jgi:hypothetical protein
VAEIRDRDVAAGQPSGTMDLMRCMKIMSASRFL